MLKHGNWKALIVFVVMFVGLAWASTKMRSLIITSSTVDSTPIGQTTASTGAFTTLTWSAAQKNCLSVSCAGGSTYAAGTTYTNSSGAPQYEEVGVTTTGSCSGNNTQLSFTVNGVSGYGNGVWNECSGQFGVSFIVPAGATFSVTITQVSGGPPASTTLSNWLEVNL
jgi:hypothetical protein